MEFKPGDTVALKSGGPIMTVTKRDGGRVWCEWFEGKATQGRYFDEIALRPANPD